MRSIPAATEVGMLRMLKCDEHSFVFVGSPSKKTPRNRGLQSLTSKLNLSTVGTHRLR